MMTTPPRPCLITCPHCHREYLGSYRTSVNFTLEMMDGSSEDEVYERFFVETCPNCQAQFDIGDAKVNYSIDEEFEELTLWQKVKKWLVGNR